VGCWDRPDILPSGDGDIDAGVVISDLGGLEHDNAIRIGIDGSEGIGVGSEVISTRDLDVPAIAGPCVVPIVCNKDKNIDSRFPRQDSVSKVNQIWHSLIVADFEDESGKCVAVRLSGDEGQEGIGSHEDGTRTGDRAPRAIGLFA
jgi:hypothetical protein